MSAERDYAVDGMSCEHCAQAIAKEVHGVDGVESTDVDVAGGKVTVRGDAFEEGAIRSAISDAGYEVRS